MRPLLLSATGQLLGNVSGVPPVHAQDQDGLLDVVLDPAFAATRRIYFSYAERDSSNPAFSGTAAARAVLNFEARSLQDVTVI